MTKSRARTLDDALRRNAPVGIEEIDRLLDVAAVLTRTFGVDVPDATRQRTLFIEGAGARRAPPGTRFLRVALPLAIVVALLGFLLYSSLAAAPGDPLYRVKRVLEGAHLAPSASDEVSDEVKLATRRLGGAQELLLSNPDEAERLALEGIFHLATARRLVPELPGGDRSRALSKITEVESDLAEVIAELRAPPPEEANDSKNRRGGSKKDD